VCYERWTDLQARQVAREGASIVASQIIGKVDPIDHTASGNGQPWRPVRVGSGVVPPIGRSWAAVGGIIDGYNVSFDRPTGVGRCMRSTTDTGRQRVIAACGPCNDGQRPFMSTNVQYCR